MLEGKVAIVTGGASGIGRATARRLAGAGATVVIVDRNVELGRAAATELGGSFEVADVGRSADWDRVVASVVRRHGGIDFAHLNAGVNSGVWEAVESMTDEQYERIRGANLDGVVFGVRALIPALSARGGGAIVATSSLAGLIGFSRDPIYTATKHAVVGLVRALGPVLQERRITINAVCPGITDTPLLDEAARQELIDSHFPIIAPEDIADAVLSCLTGDSTGEVFVCQAGSPPIAFMFRGVPGPRAVGAQGMPPPDGYT